LTLRQQSQKNKDAQILPWLILLRQRQWSYDYMGFFVTTGFVDEWAAEFERI
jgi:hypothetical protein